HKCFLHCSLNFSYVKINDIAIPFLDLHHLRHIRIPFLGYLVSSTGLTVVFLVNLLISDENSAKSLNSRYTAANRMYATWSTDSSLFITSCPILSVVISSLADSKISRSISSINFSISDAASGRL